MYTKYDQKMITDRTIELIKKARKIKTLYYHAEPFFYRPSGKSYSVCVSEPMEVCFKVKLSFSDGTPDENVLRTSNDPDYHDIYNAIFSRMLELEEVERDKRNKFDWSKIRLGDFLPSVREEINEKLK